jgi:23S rRNA (guanosine2251-2'-O)-methyltransferase
VVRKVFLAPQSDSKEIRAAALAAGIEVERLDIRKVTSYVEGNAPHQGIVARVGLEELPQPFDFFLAGLSPKTDTLLVFLGGIEDPHNTGAIIRSAAAFGASAVLIPEKGQSPITPAAAKASAGMAFRVPIIRVGNPAEAIVALKEKGVRAYGLAGDSKHSIADEPFRAPTMLVLGNEGAGLPKAVRAACDLTLSIPMHARTESLNVAASAAASMYAWAARHGKALG